MYIYYHVVNVPDNLYLGYNKNMQTWWGDRNTTQAIKIWPITVLLDILFKTRLLPWPNLRLWLLYCLLNLDSPKVIVKGKLHGCKFEMTPQSQKQRRVQQAKMNVCFKTLLSFSGHCQRWICLPLAQSKGDQCGLLKWLSNDPLHQWTITHPALWLQSLWSLWSEKS